MGLVYLPTFTIKINQMLYDIYIYHTWIPWVIDVCLNSSTENRRTIRCWNLFDCKKSIHLLHFSSMWVFPKIAIPQNGWFLMENPIKMDDLGVPIIFGNTHVFLALSFPQCQVLAWTLWRSLRNVAPGTLTECEIGVGSFVVGGRSKKAVKENNMTPWIIR